MLSIERLWTPKLCGDLVRRVREHEARFFIEDSKIFGIGGLDVDRKCCSQFCTLTHYESVASAQGTAARAAEVRRCTGPCSGYFHYECLVRGRGLDEEEKKQLWGKAGSIVCQCGCGDSSEGSTGEDQDSSDADKIEDMTDPEHAVLKREKLQVSLQKERAQKLRMVSAQVDVLLGAEHAAALAKGGAALGAAKSTMFGH
jgi:hypothetical protein